MRGHNGDRGRRCWQHSLESTDRVHDDSCGTVVGKTGKLVCAPQTMEQVDERAERCFRGRESKEGGRKEARARSGSSPLREHARRSWSRIGVTGQTGATELPEGGGGGGRQCGGESVPKAKTLMYLRDGTKKVNHARPRGTKKN